MTGFRALYYNYICIINRIKRDYKRKQNHEPSSKEVYGRFRDDIRYIRRISEEVRLLCKHSIDTDVQLKSHKQERQNLLDSLEHQRKLLRNRLRGIHYEDKRAEVKTEISELSKQMKPLRHEIFLCNEIERRSTDIKDKLRLYHEDRREMKNERSVIKVPLRNALSK